MPRARRPAYADKLAQLARGEPWIVHPAEVAKGTAHYQTDPEILLGCILVSGTLDTAVALIAMSEVRRGESPTGDRKAAYEAFYQVWAKPTAEQRAQVIAWADRLVKKSREFRWTPPM